MIPVNSLKEQVAALREELDAAIAAVLDRGWFILGPAVEQFDREWAAYCGVEHGVAVASGTEALQLALLAAGARPGDEVVTVANTAVPTVAALRAAGCVPVFIDIDPRHYTMEPAALEAAISPRTRAVIPVHLYGQCVHMDPLLAVARARGIAVIEDACQAHGAVYRGSAEVWRYGGVDEGTRGRLNVSTSESVDAACAVSPLPSPSPPHRHTPTHPHLHTPTLPHSHTPTLPHSHTPTLPRAGSLGDYGCFSFYPTKNLGALGDAGMVVTRDAAAAERLRRLRSYGQRERYLHVTEGINSRMDDLQAAVLSVKLRHLDSWNARRRGLAALYGRLLAGTPLELPAEAEWGEHVYHLYVVRVRNRESFQRYLAEHGVGTLIHYPLPVYRQEAYAAFAPPAPLPVTEAQAEEIVTLPLFPELPDESVEQVAAVIRRGFDTGAF